MRGEARHPTLLDVMAQLSRALHPTSALAGPRARELPGRRRAHLEASQGLVGGGFLGALLRLAKRYLEQCARVGEREVELGHRMALRAMVAVLHTLAPGVPQVSLGLADSLSALRLHNGTARPAGWGAETSGLCWRRLMRC